MTRNEFLKLLAAGTICAGAPILGRAVENQGMAKSEAKRELPRRPPVVIGILGDPGVGKTSMAAVYVSNQFPASTSPTLAVVNYGRSAVAVPGGSVVDVVVREISGYDASRGVWPASLPTLDVAVVVYSVLSATSFERVKSLYWPALRSYKGGRIPIVLVGNKVDLANDPSVVQAMRARGLAPVSFQQNLQGAREIGAYAGLQCSALTKQGMQEVFDRALRATRV